MSTQSSQPKPSLDETAPRQEWVCSGTGIPFQDGAKGVVFFQLIDDGKLGPQRCFGLKRFRVCKVGIVYSINATDQTAYPTSLQYVRQFEDKAMVLQWELEQQVRDLEADRLKELKNAKKISALQEALDPVRKIYLASINRAAMEVIIMKYLRGGKL